MSVLHRWFEPRYQEAITTLANNLKSLGEEVTLDLQGPHGNPAIYVRDKTEELVVHVRIRSSWAPDTRELFSMSLDVFEVGGPYRFAGIGTKALRMVEELFEALGMPPKVNAATAFPFWRKNSYKPLSDGSGLWGKVATPKSRVDPSSG